MYFFHLISTFQCLLCQKIAASQQIDLITYIKGTTEKIQNCDSL